MSAGAVAAPVRRRELSALPRAEVLLVTPYLGAPAISGGLQRLLHTARGLAAAHRTVVLAPASGVWPLESADEFLREAGVLDCVLVDDERSQQRADDAGLDHWAPAAMVARDLLRHRLPIFARRSCSPELQRAIATALKHTGAQVAWVFDPSIVEDVQAAGAETIIVDVDDIVSAVERAQFRKLVEKLGVPKRLPLLWADYWRLRHWERSLPQRFARVLVAKDEDRRFFPSRYRDRLAILPNGVRVPESVGVPPRDSRTLLFVGTLHYEPNEDALRYFLGVVLPTIWQQRPDVRFQIVGHGSLDWLDERVASEPRLSLARSVPDVRPFYEQAALVVAPVRHGGGTRIKVLEALAYGRPLVSTTFAAGGCGLVDGTHVVYADDPASFAERCVALLDAPAERTRLGEAGREFVRRGYEWSSIEATVSGIVADARAATRTLG